MIYVLTGNHQQFQGFMHEYWLRQDFGDSCKAEGCRRGHVRYLSEPYLPHLEGVRNAIVLAWGTWFERRDSEEIRDFCASRDIPFLEVPDLRRQRARREHPEQFLQW